jgi:hypothetical protein
VFLDPWAGMPDLGESRADAIESPRERVPLVPGLWSGFQPTYEPTGFQPVVVQFLYTPIGLERCI